MMQKPQYNRILPGHLNWTKAFFNRLSVAMLALWYCRLTRQIKIYGQENIPPDDQNYLVVSNHVTTKDPPLISVALRYRPIAFMAKQELFEGSWLKATYYQAMGTFAVNRDKMELSTIKSALTVLKSPKWLLGIFPEGTRRADGSVGEAKKGVAYLAKTAKVGVIPIGIACKFQPNGKEELAGQVGPLIPYDPALSQEELLAIIQDHLNQLVIQAQQLL